MTYLSEFFLSKFNEIEEAHLYMKEKVDSFIETGNELDMKLEDELNEFLQWWGDYGTLIADTVSELSEDEKIKYRDFTLNSRLSEILQSSPFFWRIVNRPEGYPGDAEMMNMIYRNSFEGSTPFGRFVTRGAVRSQICQAVRNRKTFLYNEIRKTGGGKILSLAAGPAQEMFDVLNDKDDDNIYEFLALDHDIKTLRKAVEKVAGYNVKYALANAFQIIKNDFSIAFPKMEHLSDCDPKNDFNGSFEKITEKYELGTLETDSYDLVYSAGLYDYIKTYPNDNSKGSVALTKNLFKLVKPGGTLVVGNMGPDINGSDLFSMEYLQNWLLIKRTEEEVIDFANAIPEAHIHKIEVLKEPEKINYFLRIEKK